VKAELGRAVGEVVIKPFAAIVERIGGREAELAKTEAQRIETERRKERFNVIQGERSA
jgi:hypothetical protein